MFKYLILSAFLLTAVGFTTGEEIFLRPHYHFPHYNENGELQWFPRIIGGIPANQGEFPGKTSLQYKRGAAHFCGATLLDFSSVLTAAHCVTDAKGNVMDKNSIQVMADDLYIVQNGSAARQVNMVSDIFVHKNYDPYTFANDIAVVRLTNNFNRTDSLYPVPRATSTPPDGQLCSLAGWGVTSENATTPSPILRRVDLEIVSMRICNGSTSYQGLLLPGMFCAGSMSGNRDSCQGDSGGALICNNKISGVVSFGYGCGRQNFPGVYVNVVDYNDWINNTLYARAGESSRNDAGTSLHANLTFIVMGVALVLSFLY